MRGSKSETNRALVLAALADAPGTISGGLRSRDSQLMMDALRALGAEIDDYGDVWRIVPPAEPTPAPAGIDCGLAGTVMRFVPPIAALASGPTYFYGDEHASARPMQGLLSALRQLGAEIDADRLPFTIDAPDSLGGPEVEVDATASSQFVSALLLAAPRFPLGLSLRHVGDALPSRPHIDMTVGWLRERGVDVAELEGDAWVVSPGPIAGVDAVVEPDLTNASVFLAASALTGGEVRVPHWPADSLQPGQLFAEVLDGFGVDHDLSDHTFTVTGGRPLRAIDFDLHDASELTPVVAAMALFADGTSRIRGVGHIRGHETDRLAALVTEFQRLGADASATDDGLIIEGRGAQGAGLSGTVFGCYADHRMAHAGALIGLVVDGVRLDDVAATSKTMPDFPERWMGLVS